jgi:hypothetical protein
VNTASSPEKLRTKRQVEVAPAAVPSAGEDDMEGATDQEGFSEQDEPPRSRTRITRPLTAIEAQEYIITLQIRNPDNKQIEDLLATCETEEQMIIRGTRCMEVMTDTPPLSPIPPERLENFLLSTCIARRVALKYADTAHTESQSAHYGAASTPGGMPQ